MPKSKKTPKNPAPQYGTQDADVLESPKGPAHGATEGSPDSPEFPLPSVPASATNSDMAQLLRLMHDQETRRYEEEQRRSEEEQ